MLLLLSSCTPTPRLPPQAGPTSAPASLASPNAIHPDAESAYDRGLLLTQKDPRKAAQEFDEATRIDSRHCRAWYNAGVLYERLKEPGRASERYRLALTKAAPCFHAYEGLTRQALRAGDLAEARRILVAAGVRASSHAPLRNTYAEVLLAEGKLAEAEAEARAILKLDERNAAAMINLGRVYFAQRKFELARLAIDNAREIDPENALGFHQLGLLFLQENERSQALGAFRRAVELEPELVASQINLSQLLGEAGDVEGAMAAASTAAAHAPASPRAHLALGNALRAAQRLRDAEVEYGKVLAQDQDSTEARYNLGVLYLDGELAGVDALDRLDKATTYLGEYLTVAKLGHEDTQVVEAMIAQARRQRESEKKKREREEKRRLNEAASQPASRPVR